MRTPGIAALAALLAACAGVSYGPGHTVTVDHDLPSWAIQGRQPGAYGPGVDADATGRPIEWRTEQGELERGSVQPDAYGPGVGMDGYGRPVRARSR
jgi:hypothetical protein